MNERGEFVGVPLAGHPPLLLLELGSLPQLGQIRRILLAASRKACGMTFVS
ncbi:hypothetical protein [Streptomyces sp. NPDC005731]|uniref:hypothetical protein n=1 Tax=unclassified Streptomyces TaxID=2593676 RepID=UPI0033DB6594